MLKLAVAEEHVSLQSACSLWSGWNAWVCSDQVVVCFFPQSAWRHDGFQRWIHEILMWWLLILILTATRCYNVARNVNHTWIRQSTSGLDCIFTHMFNTCCTPCFKCIYIYYTTNPDTGSLGLSMNLSSRRKLIIICSKKLYI